MAQSSVLTAQKRTKVGTLASRALRASGRIPANIQGPDVHIDISIDEREFLTSRRAHVHLYDIDLEGEAETAVVRELEWDTFGDRIIHIEFKRVIRGVETEAEVSIDFYGHPSTGLLNKQVSEITVRCLPSMIPDSIQVRVDRLEEGDHVKAGDLELPEGVALAVPESLELATIVAAKHRAVDVPAESEDTDVEGGAAPEDSTDGEGGDKA